MASDSGNRKNPHLKTYSRRVKPRVEEPPPKRQRIEEKPLIREPSPVEKFGRSSIRSYFTPIRASSSATSGRSTLPSSDSLEAPSSIPSSPPPRSPSPISQERQAQKRPKRRLTSRLLAQPVVKMEDEYSTQTQRKVFYDNTGVGWFPYMVLEHGWRNHFWMYDEDGNVVPLISCEMEEAEEEAAEYRRKDQARRREERKEERKANREPRYDEDGELIEEESEDDSESDDPESESNVDETAYEEDGNRTTKPVSQNRNRGKLTLKSGKYRQTKLDLGQSSIVDCKKCDMAYDKTVAEDRKVHDAYHGRYLWGSKWDGTKTIKHPEVIVSLRVDEKYVEHRIQALTCRNRLEWRDHFEDALKTAQVDLPGPPLEELELWEQIQDPHSENTKDKIPRYKVFVYYIHRNIVGVLLVERIKGGVPCLFGDPDEPADMVTKATGMEQSSQQTKVGIRKCYMSVDRIWVHSECRRQGIATSLVDSARENLIPSMEISKDHVAFSWPTKMGFDFALSYCDTHFHDLGLPYSFLVSEADVPSETAIPGRCQKLKAGEGRSHERAFLEFTALPYKALESREPAAFD